MKKFPLILCTIALLALVGWTSYGQTAKGQSSKSATANQPCKLTVAQSPEIRGVRLGMTAAKLLAAFPEENNQAAIENANKVSKHPASYGMGRFDLRSNPTNPRFSYLDYITVDLLDERVSGFHVAYVGPEWKRTEQFISKLSEAFHLLPAEDWSGDSTDPNRSLKCDGFVVNAYNSGGNNSSVSVRDVSAPQTVHNRREAEKEKVRQAFKP